MSLVINTLLPFCTMASSTTTMADERAGAEIVYGPEECRRRTTELLEELGFPAGVMPLKELVECGRVHETGFIWMKQKAASQHFFEGTKSLVSYAAEVTAYVEKSKMKRMSGVKSKQAFIWVPIAEMSIFCAENGKNRKILFKTPMGFGKSYPASAFMTIEENEKNLHQLQDNNEGVIDV